MIYLIVLCLINFASAIALAFYIRKLKKYFKYKIDEEQFRRRQLEEFYMQFHQDFAEHCYKYH